MINYMTSTEPKLQTPYYTTDRPVHFSFQSDDPPKGIIIEIIGSVTFVHTFDAALQLTCVPGVICALRIE